MPTDYSKFASKILKTAGKLSFLTSIKSNIPLKLKGKNQTKSYVIGLTFGLLELATKVADFIQNFSRVEKFHIGMIFSVTFLEKRFQNVPKLLFKIDERSILEPKTSGKTVILA